MGDILVLPSKESAETTKRIKNLKSQIKYAPEEH